MESTSLDWRDKAACLRADPELFFPTGEKSAADIEQIRKAKLFCADCLSRIECLDYALRTSQSDGVWGGMSEDERRALKKAAARARVRTDIARNGRS
jgi:WhiB family redox-sensing transcriptional regulator